MFVAAKNESPLQFLWRRLTRIAPLYWLATLTIVIVSSKNEILLGKPIITGEFFKSIFFIPHFNKLHPGMIWPILVPGWTLNFEMFFYIIFTIGLLLKRLTPTILVSITSLFIIGIFYNGINPIFITYTNPILLEFMAGYVLGYFLNSIDGRFFAFMAPIGFAAIVFSPLYEANRLLEWGLPAVMIVTGMVALEKRGKLPFIQYLKFLGDASYSIYLFQVFSIGFATKIVRRVYIHDSLQIYILLLLSLAGSIFLGILVHILLEKPLARFFKKVVSSWLPSLARLIHGVGYEGLAGVA